jgi:hypothetical protein
MLPTGTPEEEEILQARVMNSLIGSICYQAGVEEGDIGAAPRHQRDITQLLGKANDAQLEEVRSILIQHGTQISYGERTEPLTLRAMLYSTLISYREFDERLN